MSFPVEPDKNLSQIAERELLVNARIEALRTSMQLSRHRPIKSVLGDAQVIEEWILRDPTDAR